MQLIWTKMYLWAQRSGLCEVVEVLAREGECDWLVHFDDNRLIFLVYRRRLSQFYVRWTDVAWRWELYSYDAEYTTDLNLLYFAYRTKLFSKVFEKCKKYFFLLF